MVGVYGALTPLRFLSMMFGTSLTILVAKLFGDVPEQCLNARLPSSTIKPHSINASQYGVRKEEYLHELDTSVAPRRFPWANETVVAVSKWAQACSVPQLPFAKQHALLVLDTQLLLAQNKALRELGERPPLSMYPSYGTSKNEEGLIRGICAKASRRCHHPGWLSFALTRPWIGSFTKEDVTEHFENFEGMGLTPQLPFTKSAATDLVAGVWHLDTFVLTLPFVGVIGFTWPFLSGSIAYGHDGYMTTKQTIYVVAATTLGYSGPWTVDFDKDSGEVTVLHLAHVNFGTSASEKNLKHGEAPKKDNYGGLRLRTVQLGSKGGVDESIILILVTSSKWVDNMPVCLKWRRGK